MHFSVLQSKHSDENKCQTPDVQFIFLHPIIRDDLFKSNRRADAKGRGVRRLARSDDGVYADSIKN